MTIRANAPAMEPSPEAVVAIRERLRGLGFLLTEDAARDLLRGILGIESAHLDRRAREAASARLRSIQEAAREALAILTQGPPAVTAPMAAAAPAPAPKPAAAPRRDQPVNLAEIVRQRLGDDAPRDDPASRPHEPLPPPPPAPARPASHNRAPEPAPAPVSPEPRRPVFKGRRGR